MIKCNSMLGAAQLSSVLGLDVSFPWMVKQKVLFHVLQLLQSLSEKT